MRRLCLLIALCAPVLLHAQQSTNATPRDPLNFFVGHWQGTTQGQPGQGRGKRDYEFVLGGKFLQLKNSTVYPPQEKNPKGETHEDLGLYSHDKKRNKLVFRQFHVEGFVNQYVEQERAPDGKKFVFISEAIENIPDGWRARETYTILNENEYAEVFERAPPQKQSEIYSESRWKRVK